MICSVLIIDDDRQQLDILKRYLEKHDMKVITALDGREGMRVAEKIKPDLVITDMEMPHIDGGSLCEKLKKLPGAKKTPVIIISGKKISEKDMLEGYARGSDDYLIKPFSLPILVAKIKNLLMLYEKYSRAVQSFKKWRMQIDFEAKEIKINGKKTRLTRKEFDLFVVLMKKKGKVANISYLLENVWGYDPALYNNPHTVEVHISSIRRKLGRKIGSRIKKVTGYGYKFEY